MVRDGGERKGRHGRTDAQCFLARKAEALSDDAGPRHHNRGAVHNGRLELELILVEDFVKIEASECGAFVRRWAGQQLAFEAR